MNNFIELNKVDDKLEGMADDEDEDNQCESRSQSKVSSLPAVEGGSGAASPGQYTVDLCIDCSDWLMIVYRL